MNTERWLDKTEYGDGPWQHEPDRIEWRSRGLPCLMLRNERFGHWCGYVGVPPGHPWHGMAAEDVPAEVHGGINFAEPCDDEGPTRERVCHMPLPGESDDVWWLGFDCLHFMDRGPLFEARERAMFGTSLADMAHGFMRPTYKTAGWVRVEVETLAEQAADAS